MPMTLDSYGVERLQKLGVPIVNIAKPTFKLEDIMGVTSLDREAINKDFTDPKPGSPPFKEFGSDATFRYMSPNASAYAAAALKGTYPKNIINPGEAASLHRTFKRISGQYGRMYDELSVLQKLSTEPGLVGTSQIGPQLGTALKGISSATWAKGFGLDKFADFLLRTKTEDGGDLSGKTYAQLSPQDKFTARGRLVLAKMAPVILGESGKTISDADRILVAESLGFVVNKITRPDGSQSFGGITGFNSNLLRNPAAVTEAINRTAALIRERYEDVYEAYAAEMEKYDVSLPGMKRYAPNPKRTKSPTLRFDLRKKAQT